MTGLILLGMLIFGMYLDHKELKRHTEIHGHKKHKEKKEDKVK